MYEEALQLVLLLVVLYAHFGGSDALLRERYPYDKCD